ncbi:MAG: GIY-YIG nuclease family protein [Candidatus Paceibacterota bacterium]
MFYVYMIKNNANKLYIGVTKNIDKRINSHNINQGANFTKNKNSFELVFQEKYDTLKEARQREIQLKKWRREKKEMLIKRYLLELETKN